MIMLVVKSAPFVFFSSFFFFLVSFGFLGMGSCGFAEL